MARPTFISALHKNALNISALQKNALNNSAPHKTALNESAPNENAPLEICTFLKNIYVSILFWIFLWILIHFLRKVFLRIFRHIEIIFESKINNSLSKHDFGIGISKLFMLVKYRITFKSTKHFWLLLEFKIHYIGNCYQMRSNALRL